MQINGPGFIFSFQPLKKGINKKVQISFWVVFNLLFLQDQNYPSLRRNRVRHLDENERRGNLTEILWQFFNAYSAPVNTDKGKINRWTILIHPEGRHLIHIQLAQFPGT